MTASAVAHAQTLLQLHKAGTIVSEESWASAIRTLVNLVASGITFQYSFDGEFYSVEATYQGRTVTGISRKGTAVAASHAIAMITPRGNT